MRPPPLQTDRHALFLDFDGTLVAFADTPDDITISHDLREMLHQLQMAMDGAFAFVTGRAAANLAGHLHMPFVIAGSHGAEIRERDGTTHNLASPIEKERVDAISRFVQQHPPLVMEKKAGGLTVHYRRDPSLKSATKAVLEAHFSALPQMEIMAGAMMFEVREKNLHKGSAIEALMKRPEYRDRVPIFLGDDVTDEDGFRAVNAAGGVSVKIGAGATGATHRLPDIGAVHAWLSHAVASRTLKESTV
ncbi:MAG: trehalose-phosphatase [Pseudomonadota bacterium]